MLTETWSGKKETEGEEKKNEGTQREENVIVL